MRLSSELPRQEKTHAEREDGKIRELSSGQCELTQQCCLQGQDSRWEVGRRAKGRECMPRKPAKGEVGRARGWQSKGQPGLLTKTLPQSHKTKPKAPTADLRLCDYQQSALDSICLSVYLSIYLSKYLGAGKMAQWLRALAALPRDLASVFSTYIVAYSHL